jgi:hypothetical protein
MRVSLLDHSEVKTLIISHHARQRFRARANRHEDELYMALAEAEITSWQPPWVDSDTPTALWALNGEFAFPLRPTSETGCWLVLTCLVRPRA